MNIYQFKRDEILIQPNEYAGFIVRAINQDHAEELVFNEYSMARTDWEEEYYDDELDITLIASGVTGEPGVLMVDFRAYSNLQLAEKLENTKQLLNRLYGIPINREVE